MQTRFSAEQLRDPATRASESELRRCVHCGFCTATCPTYVLLGDELDSPRGRIYLIQEMLESAATPDPRVVLHIDRCLSCLACESTCPSGVRYEHLIDHARSYIETHYRRPWRERWLRATLAHVLPYRARFAALLRLGRALRFAALPLARILRWQSLRAMLELLPVRVPPTKAIRCAPRSGSVPSPLRPTGTPGTIRRVAVLRGCAEPVLRPQVRAATVRMLERLGIAVVEIAGEACCGAIAQHLGRRAQALSQARANVARWRAELAGAGLDAIITTAAGCGTMLENYPFLLAQTDDADGALAELSRRMCDVSELLLAQGLPALEPVPRLRIAYQSACSLQHGQRVREAPVALLRAAGFEVLEPEEAHLCCGSAGTYNLLQPQIAAALRERKLTHLQALAPDVIASGNIGCMLQLRGGTSLPVVHTVELLDWASGGPAPAELAPLLSRCYAAPSRSP